jgi:hypothetical protein
MKYRLRQLMALGFCGSYAGCQNSNKLRYRLGERSIDFYAFINLCLWYRHPMQPANIHQISSLDGPAVAPYSVLLGAMEPVCLSAARDGEVHESIIDERIRLSMEEWNVI